ncbi:MAG: tRNA (adenosine(37)-N6)-threonylcarbamoyltransferase complex ATPase subunit type 1 TsaE [Chloroflexi bacterium]|nr:tRNA (adenosine(37)-N6)-threonylcarbamoyltransferase complex ATPase subunit type 1 TsaE [Chloroflexota bacterium]
MTEILISENPEATRAWAKRLAQKLKSPQVVALYGDLGAGKTVVAQGIAAGLGVTAPITSPTFTLINEYDLPDGGKLFHVDCYRLNNAVEEAKMLGLEELFDEGVVLIEWADRIAPLLPKRRLDIKLEDAGPGHRRIQLLTRE